MMGIFWTSILITVIFAYSTIKLGFYHAWTMLFNLLVAVYLAVRIGPVFGEFLPAAVNGQYGGTLALLVTGMGTFLILQSIAYVLLIGQFEVTFPRAVNVIGSGLMGFLAGFLVCSFIMLVICTTPFCQKQYVKEIGLDTKTFEETKMQSYLVWWCKFIDEFVASGSDTVSVEKTIKDLLTMPAASAAKNANLRNELIRQHPVDTNEPNRPNYPGRLPATSPRESNTEIPP